MIHAVFLRRHLLVVFRAHQRLTVRLLVMLLTMGTPLKARHTDPTHSTHDFQPSRCFLSHAFPTIQATFEVVHDFIVI